MNTFDTNCPRCEAMMNKEEPCRFCDYEWEDEEGATDSEQSYDPTDYTTPTDTGTIEPDYPGEGSH